MLYDLPVTLDTNNKAADLNKIAKSLVEAIININDNEILNGIHDGNHEESCKFTRKLVKVGNKHETIDKDCAILATKEITKLLENCNLNFNAEEIQYIVKEILKILQNTTNSKFYNTNIKEKIQDILQGIGNLPVYLAMQVADKLLIKLNDFLSNENICTTSTNICKSATNLDYHSTSQNVLNSGKSVRLINSKEKFDNEFFVVMYKFRIMAEINEWLMKNINSPILSNQNVRNKVIEDFADDIIDRKKYLDLIQINNGMEDELQQLKYQIFKWINKFVGEDNIEPLEYASELLERINSQSITKFHTLPILNTRQNYQATGNVQNLEKASQYMIKLTDVISVWFHNLPNDLHFSQNKNMRNILINDLVKVIDKLLKAKGISDEIIDNEVTAWINKSLRGLPTRPVIENLKEQIRIILKEEKMLDCRKESISIRKYEDIIDEWMNNISVEPRNGVLYIDRRNECVHDLAVKLYKRKFRYAQTPEDIITNELQDVISNWLQKFPLILDKDKITDQYTATFVKRILDSNVDESIKVIEDLSYIEARQSEIDYNIVTDLTGDELLERNIRCWIEKLQIDKEVNNISCQNTFISNLKQLHRTGEDEEKLRNEIGDFLNMFTLSSDSFVNQQKKLLEILRVTPKEYVQKKSGQNINIIYDAIEVWSKNLPLRFEHSHRDLNFLIKQMATRLTKLITYPNLNLWDENKIKCEIMEYLQKFPLRLDANNKNLFKYVLDLWEILKNIEFYMRNSNNMPSLANTGNDKISKPINLNGIENLINFNNNPVIYASLSNIKQKPINKNKSDNQMSTSKMPIFGPSGSGGSLKESRKRKSDRKLSSPAELGVTNSSQSVDNFCPDTAGIEHLPQGMTVKEVYEYFSKIFNNRCQEIPVEASTPEQNTLAQLAKKSIYNGIWKTFFKLKSDSEIENDYSYFELLFEEQLDKMLDCLPQTLEMQKNRQSWKGKVLVEIINMLKYIHSITDRPSFREKISEKINRQFIAQYYLEGSDILQHYFVTKTADDYILYTKYKEENPVKSNVYRQRLMKRLEELVEEIKIKYNIQFRYLNQAQLCRIAFGVLKSVDPPNDETLTEEANEILLDEEVEDWCNALPLKPVFNEAEGILRCRMRELLSKKLYQMEKEMDPEDLSYERNMKHEVSKFLEKYAALDHNEDLNINFMVEELANRLRNKRQEKYLGYESFEKDKPVSSTFIQTDIIEPLAVLVDIEPKYDLTDQNLQMVTQNTREAQDIPGTIQEIPSQNRRLGLLGTSQIAGPSKRSSLLNNKEANSHSLSNSFNMSEFESTEQPYSRIRNHVNRSCYLRQEIDQSDSWKNKLNFQRVPKVGVTQSYAQRLGENDIHMSYTPEVLSTGFARTQSPSGRTASTARIANQASPQHDLKYGDEQEQESDADEVRIKCRCMERKWKCSRRFPCRPISECGQPCYPVPPCRYFY
ncbi:uncharacterized protein LOC131852248 [Achroia grisella]|uniref:uncharacterized protein LOC131852248 n=1 Tax=Achroia grisella TaxID=688607 RepID=UPI0027D20AE6|nr:uncharacterized protein LOC131852248 [Achroia grisella]